MTEDTPAESQSSPVVAPPVGQSEEARPALLSRALHAASSARRLARISKAFHVAVFGLSRGRLMGRWFGSPVLILEVVGRRSGKRRRTPMTYCLLEGTYVVVAINGGSSRVPAWWLNLRTSGEGTIAVRGARHQVAARESAGPERERLWRAYAKQAPALEDFRSFAGREIPVVVLEPIEPVPANER